VPSLDDDELRAATFAYLDSLMPLHGGQVWGEDLKAFTFKGQRLSLLQHMRGIRVISGLAAALTIRTTFRANPETQPYADSEGPDGYFRYKWRGTDPSAFDNMALREAMRSERPLAWFFGVAPNWFIPVYPIWLVDEEPSQHQFVVAFDRAMREQWSGSGLLEHPVDLALRRQYAEATVKRRLHQPVFRRRVLSAYGSQCAVCHLRHDELLDAAHIKEDADGGQPVVPNGLAMCAIHHRAFDSDVLGITPSCQIRIRADILVEKDGPTLRYALQGLHKSNLHVPVRKTAHPNAELLEDRYERFLAAG
jgi:putative restriction endonuclease